MTQKVKVRGHSVKKNSVETDGRTDGGDSLPYITSIALKQSLLSNIYTAIREMLAG